MNKKLEEFKRLNKPEKTFKRIIIGIYVGVLTLALGWGFYNDFIKDVKTPITSSIHTTTTTTTTLPKW